jgi:hypothetical protein
MRKGEQNNQLNQDRHSKPIAHNSDQNHILWECLLLVLSNRIAGYPTSLDEDEALLKKMEAEGDEIQEAKAEEQGKKKKVRLDGKMRKRWKSALIVRIGEKKILQKVMEVVKKKLGELEKKQNEKAVDLPN